MSFSCQMVHDEERRVCLQINMDGHVATHALPDGFGRRSDDAQKGYIEAVVPEMIRRLIYEKNSQQRKIRRSL